MVNDLAYLTSIHWYTDLLSVAISIALTLLSVFKESCELLW